MRSVSIDVVCSCACRICGGIRAVVVPSGCDYKNIVDTGLCAYCRVDDSMKWAGDIHEQVDYDVGEYCVDADCVWSYQEQAAIVEKYRLKDRYPPATLETRTCPVCCSDFDVLVHARSGRTRKYCCKKCLNRAMVRRHRQRCNVFEPDG